MEDPQHSNGLQRCPWLRHSTNHLTQSVCLIPCLALPSMCIDAAGTHMHWCITEASEVLETLSSPEAWIRTIKAREGGSWVSVDSTSTCSRDGVDMRLTGRRRFGSGKDCCPGVWSIQHRGLRDAHHREWAHGHARVVEWLAGVTPEVAELLVVHVVKRHHKILISNTDASYECTILTQ
jgi:hypothetical protein